MRPELDLAQVTTAAALDAEARDGDGAFPRAALDALTALGVTACPPLETGRSEDLLWLLAATGRGDLNVGRILEGHVNALFLIRRFGTPEQRRLYGEIADQGGLFGVWNTDLPGAPLRLEGDRLVGKKSFSTGVDGLSHAIVTIASDQGREMLMVPLGDFGIDRSWWRPLGMRASGSHVVDFTDFKIGDEHGLGPADAYVRQPWFSAGAMRFAAVQVGGMHAILDIATDHLNGIGRAADPYQRHRLGRMATAVETGYGWLRRAAEGWSRAETDDGEGTADEAVATVNAARGAVEIAALAVLELAERGVGAGGMIAPHPLERHIRDLRTYLRQPNPDGALAALGEAVSTGVWAPGLRPQSPGV